MDHAFYLSYAVGGPHDLLFEDITVDGRGGLATAFHFYHSDSTNKNAWNVTVRRLHVTGTQQAIILWDSTLRNITFDTADITNALKFAVRHEAAGATGIVYANITSTGSGSSDGFYSSAGNPRPASRSSTTRSAERGDAPTLAAAWSANLDRKKQPSTSARGSGHSSPAILV